MTRKLLPGGCPTSFQLAELVEGVADPETAQEILAHAAECEACGQTLRQMIANQEVELTEEEQRVADELVAPEQPPLEKLTVIDRRGRRWMPFAAAAAVIIAVAGWSLWRAADGAVDGLLRQAYTERRPFEWRLPDAGHGRVVRELGAGDRSFSRPASLLEAQARIARGLSDKSPRTLLGKGWAELLDLDTAAAIHSLERARTAAPQDMQIALVLGVAYAARGEADNSAADLARAVDRLTEVLSREPRNAVARFNRALVQQRLSLLPLAITDWKAFLEVDNKSGWAEEARAYLAAAEKLVGEHQRLLDREKAGAGAFLNMEAGALPLDRYLDRPVLEWMLTTSPAAAEAVESLAKRLERESEDPWLRELIREGTARRPEAVSRLLRLYDLNRAGRTQEVLEGFEEEYRALAGQGMQAAAARVVSEGLYARYRSFSAEECGKALAGDARLAAARRYPYLEVQILTNLGNCHALSGGLEGTLAFLRKAAKEAEAHHYFYAAFRARALEVTYRIESGDHYTTWNPVRDLLGEYWTAAMPESRLNQFMNDLATLAERSQLTAAAFVFNRGAAETASRIGNPLMEGVARSLTAARAAKANLAEEAMEQIQIAERLFARLEASPVRDTNWDFSRITRARAEALRGGVAGGLAILSDVAKRNATPDWELGYYLYQTKGEVELEAGAASEASKSAERAIAILRQRQQGLGEGERSSFVERLAVSHRVLASARLRLGDEIGAGEAVLASRQGLGGTEGGEQPYGGALIVATRLGDAIHLWVGSDAGLRYRARAESEKVLGLAAQVVELASRPDTKTATIEESVSRMNEALFGAAGRPRGHGIRIVADAEAGLIPWGLLMDVEEENVEVVRSPRRAAAQRLSRESPVAILSNARGQVYRGQRYPAVPSIEEEAASIERVFPKAKRWPGVDVGEWFRGARDGAIHIAAHGVSHGGTSAILLSQEPEVLLTAASVREVDGVGVRLVVLSSCSAGADRTSREFDPVSLSMALLDRGAGAVIASTWPADAEANGHLMRELYGRLAAGDAPARALQHAKQTLRRQARFAHPYFWAGYLTYI